MTGASRTRLEHEVLGEISGEDQLGRQHQVGAHLLASVRAARTLEIARDVADLDRSWASATLRDCVILLCYFRAIASRHVGRHFAATTSTSTFMSGSARPETMTSVDAGNGASGRQRARASR